MKKLIGLITVLMLFSMVLVSAGSIEDLDYKDSNLFWNLDRQVDDYDVEIDADTLDGYSANYFKHKDRQTNKYINSNEAEWIKDDASVSYSGSGMDSRRLSRYLTGFTDMFDVYDNFVDYLETIFATKVDVENAQLRMDNLEARINLGADATSDEIMKEALIIGAERKGMPLVINGMTCTKGMCIKVN